MKMGGSGTPMANYEYGRRVKVGVPYDLSVSNLFIKPEGYSEKGGEGDNQNARQVFPIYTLAIPQ